MKTTHKLAHSTFTNRIALSNPFYGLCLLILAASHNVCLSQVQRWENNEGPPWNRVVIPGTEDINLGPNVDLSGWNTNDRNLRDAHFTSWLPYRGEVLDLKGADFSKSWLDNAEFGVWPGISFPAGFVPTANLEDADFAGASLAGTHFIRANLSNANLAGADLTNATLGANLTGANLTDAIVTGTRFHATSWGLWTGWEEAYSSTGFTPQQLYSTRSYREKDLRGTSYSGDLSGWNFKQQNLSGAVFQFADLSNADLSEANLSGARFSGDLSGADLSGADLTDAFISVRDIDGANLSNTRLVNAYFDLEVLDSFDDKANLAGANLKNTYLLEAETWEFSSNTVYNQWSVLPIDPVAAGLKFEPSPLGDFDANDVFDLEDYAMLGRQISDHVLWWFPDEMFDLNRDGSLDQHDLKIWIVDVKQGIPGDADLDGEVAFSDFLILSENFGGPGGWTSGDFDFSGDVQFADFLLLSENFGSSSSIAAAVPEPSGQALGLFGLLALMGFRKRFTGRRNTCPVTHTTGAVFERFEHRNMLTAIGFATHEVDVSTNANAPSVVIAADIDGDDDQDVVVASLSDHRLAWYENTDSQGSFGKHHIVAAVDTYFPRSLAVADLDGDGDLDLIGTSVRPSNTPSVPSERIVSWHENLDGKGNFGRLQLLHTSSSELRPGTQTMEVADVDRDGHLDILVATTGGISNDVNQSFEISWLRNVDGLASFAERRTLYVGEGKLLSHDFADMDGDGDLDLLLVSESASPDLPDPVRNITTNWVEQTGPRGTFANGHVLAEATTEDYYTSHVLVIDMDNDGDNDVLSSRPVNDGEGYTDQLFWFDNKGGRTFAERSLAAHPQGAALHFLHDNVLHFVRDLNGDGLPDLISNDGRKLIWYPSLDGKGAFGDAVRVDANVHLYPTSLDTADFDSDGVLDVVVASRSHSSSDPDAVIWLKNTDGKGTFSVGGEISAQKPRATFLHASDMDADGDLDLFAAFENRGSDDSMAWYENTDGLGTFGEANHIESEEYWRYNVLRRIDLDDDGYLDIVHSGDGSVYWLQNLQGEGFAQEELVLDIFDHYDDAFSASFDFGDFDADGDLDILSTAELELTAEERQLPEYSGESHKMVIAWHENIGVQESLQFSQDAHFVSEGPRVTASTADFDRDGDTDILTRQNGVVSGIGRIGLRENLGAGVFGEKRTIVESARELANIVPTDIDGDQDLDLLVTYWGDCGDYYLGGCEQDLVWYLNTDGTFGAPLGIAPYLLDRFFAVDFDSDGNVDIVTASTGVAWHEDDGNGQFLPRETIGRNIFPEQLADIDGDGDLDAISTSRNAAFAWHENRIAGDADGDGEVSFADFLVLSENFGRQIDVVWAESDFNEDGKVGFADFLILSKNFGKTSLGG